MAVINAQYHSANPELRFCTGSNPDRDVWKVFDDENLYENGPGSNRPLSSNHSAKAIQYYFDCCALVT